jgi:hypothetical protein
LFLRSLPVSQSLQRIPGESDTGEGESMSQKSASVAVSQLGMFLEVFGHSLAFLVRLEVCSTSQLELSREILSLFSVLLL